MKTRIRKLLLRLLQLALALAFVAALLAFAGVFRRGVVEPGTRAAPPGLPAPAQVERARRAAVPIVYEAVGSVRSRVRVTLAPQVGGQVVAVHKNVGQAVLAGEELARLETAELDARVGQARGALAAARAAREQAARHHERTAALFERQAATPEQRDAALAALAGAEALQAAAEERLAEAEVALARARLSSPIAGVVAERLVEPGDLAWPGRPLLVVHDPAALRLEASVREGLYGRVSLGEEVEVLFPAIERTARGVVEEVVPVSDSASRSFVVKVALPGVEGLVPGMFGRLRLPLGEREAVLVPERAIARVGQLATVRVRAGERWERRHVALGQAHGELREVLAGLAGGEELGWDG